MSEWVVVVVGWGVTTHDVMPKRSDSGMHARPLVVVTIFVPLKTPLAGKNPEHRLCGSLDADAVKRLDGIAQQLYPAGVTPSESTSLSQVSWNGEVGEVASQLEQHSVALCVVRSLLMPTSFRMHGENLELNLMRNVGVGPTQGFTGSTLTESNTTELFAERGQLSPEHVSPLAETPHLANWPSTIA
jgi:hypothetical protein